MLDTKVTYPLISSVERAAKPVGIDIYKLPSWEKSLQSLEDLQTEADALQCRTHALLWLRVRGVMMGAKADRIYPRDNELENFASSIRKFLSECENILVLTPESTIRLVDLIEVFLAAYPLGDYDEIAVGLGTEASLARIIDDTNLLLAQGGKFEVAYNALDISLEDSRDKRNLILILNNIKAQLNKFYLLLQALESTKHLQQRLNVVDTDHSAFNTLRIQCVKIIAITHDLISLLNQATTSFPEIQNRSELSTDIVVLTADLQDYSDRLRASLFAVLDNSR